MYKIINGKKYDTKTATLIHSWDSGHPGTDFDHWEEDLYRTSRGNYFICGGGGPASPYARSVSGGGYAGGSEIRPVTEHDAIHWLETHDGEEVLLEQFPEHVEDA